MANNNTKSRFRQVKRGQSQTFEVPMKRAGNRGSEYSTRTVTVNRTTRPRLSHSGKGKVGGRRNS